MKNLVEEIKEKRLVDNNKVDNYTVDGIVLFPKSS